MLACLAKALSKAIKFILFVRKKWGEQRTLIEWDEDWFCVSTCKSFDRQWSTQKNHDLSIVWALEIRAKSKKVKSDPTIKERAPSSFLCIGIVTYRQLHWIWTKSSNKERNLSQWFKENIRVKVQKAWGNYSWWSWICQLNALLFIDGPRKCTKTSYKVLLLSWQNSNPDQNFRIIFSLKSLRHSF